VSSPSDALVVAITGAGSGIGEALAACFRDDGHTVATSDIGALAGGSVAEADVTDAASVQGWIDGVLAEHGRIDALIANAGLGKRVTVEEAAWDEIESVVNVNLFGVLHSFRAVLPSMRAAGHGRLVALVSRNAELCPARLVGYNASKAGVIATVRTLKRELDGVDILVNGLVPGPTRSGMNPTGEREPGSCYPTAKMLCTLPAGGPSGRSFFDGEDYPMWSKFS
jgi:2-hydroxycyclohexanecarboxyl-CoA dehydrogenase